MAFPTDLEIEVAFNNDIDETDHAQTGWTSVLPYVASFSGDLRGRDYELDRTEAGTLQVVLDNSDGRFLPGSVQSPYYPYVKSDRRFRIRGKNMVHPNVARGGSRDRDTTGFMNPIPGITTSTHTNTVSSFDTPIAITASAEPNAPLQGKEKLNDRIKTTMWTINTQAGSVTYQYAAAIRMQTYSLTIPAGNPNNNPKTWTVQGSTNGSSWTTIDTVTGNTWTDDFETQTFTIDSPGFYNYYKLDITANIGATSNTQLAEFNLFYAGATDLPIPTTDLTHYTTLNIPAGQTILTWHELTGWFVPLEYGVRLTHSAYMWRISGTEPTGWRYKIHITYLDKDLTPISSYAGIPDPSQEVYVLPTTTTPTQLSFSHTPPSGAKYGVMNVAFYTDTTNAGAILYGLTGIQSELPTNLAPDISGYRDIFNWQIESNNTPGTIVPVSSGFGTGAIVETTSPAYVSANATTVTTASFTPANNSLLVAMCAAGNGAHVAMSLGTVTDSLGGTWTRKVSDVDSVGAITEIWIRDVVTGAPMTVTYDPGGTAASGLSLKVQVLTGACPVANQTGVAFANGGFPYFQRDMLTILPNSRVYGAIARALPTTDLFVNSNTTLYGQIAGTGGSGDVSGVFKSTNEIDLPQVTSLGFINLDTGAQRIAMLEIFAAGQTPADPFSASVQVVWTADDTNVFITIPHLIPGELYAATVEARKTVGQPNVLFTGNEGETGDLVSSTTWSQYTVWFTAQQPEQELRFILQGTPSAGTGLEIRKLRVEKVIDQPTNFIGNYGFETDTLFWSPIDGSVARSTSQFNSGVASALITPNGTGPDPRIEAGSLMQLAAVPNDWITVSGWIRPTTTNKQIRIGVNWYDSGNTFLSASTTNHFVNAAATWQYVTATVQAPASTAYARARIGLTGTPAVTDTAYVDDISMWKAPLSLPITAIETGVTSWQRPKDIFEGWVERWPSVAGHTEMTITVVDRLKRLGDIDLTNTLKESLLQDEPVLLMPLTDSMLDTPGRFSQLGSWADDEGGPSFIDITASRGDLGVSSYTTSTDDGPTGEASFKNNPADITISGKGYFFFIPYSPDYTSPPPSTTPPTGTPKPPPPSTGGKTTYTKRWYATWSRSYEGDDSTRFDDSPYMYQGQFSGSPGNQKSLAGFDYKNIAATLAGAEVLEAHITIKNSHARWNKGLYAFVGSHNYTSKPGTWSGGNVRERRWKVWVTEGGSVTVNAGTTFGNELKSGASRGIGIGPESDSDNYGYFYGATHSGRPYITIKYRK